jgi:L-iditol 2-dehydrogenase
VKALVKAAPRPGALELQELPAPRPRADEVLLRVVSASICGSDLHMAEWHPMARWMKTPVILGHEIAGTVVETGAEVQGFRPGDRVAVESVIWCGRCRPCREGRTNVCEARELFGIHQPGGLAEQIAVPERLLHRLPDGLGPEWAALAEPATVALHAVFRCPPRPGETVLVTGPGPIGLLAGQVARAAGAHVLVAGTPADAAARLPAARELGLETLDPQAPVRDALAAAGHQGPVDLALECSGAGPALDAALQLVRRGGTITLIGQPAQPPTFDVSAALRAELTLYASYFGTWQDMETVLRLLSDGTIDIRPLVRPYPLEQVLQAFEDAAAQRVLKPVVQPSRV